jgi:hypothetical protein
MSSRVVSVIELSAPVVMMDLPFGSPDDGPM